jgi:hypothetical protein
MTMMAPVRAMVERPYRISLIAGPAAAAQARRHVWAIIRAWDIHVEGYTTDMLTSELVVTPSARRVEHDPVELVVTRSTALRVEVHRSRSAPAGCAAVRRSRAGPDAADSVHRLGLP